MRRLWFPWGWGSPRIRNIKSKHFPFLSHDSYWMYDFGLILIFCIVWTWNYFASKFVYFLSFCISQAFPKRLSNSNRTFTLDPHQGFCWAKFCNYGICFRISRWGHQDVRAHSRHLLNAHLVDDFALTPKLTQNYVEGTMHFLGIFDKNLVVVVSEEK